MKTVRILTVIVLLVGSFFAGSIYGQKQQSKVTDLFKRHLVEKVIESTLYRHVAITTLISLTNKTEKEAAEFIDQTVWELTPMVEIDVSDFTLE